jgi:hypothetical protein
MSSRIFRRHSKTPTAIAIQILKNLLMADAKELKSRTQRCDHEDPSIVGADAATGSYQL